MKNVASKDVVSFIKEHIIYPFGIPQTITTDQGTVFTSEEFENFYASLKIKLLNSLHYYTQANGQRRCQTKA
jgi:hypothetical protein